MSRRRRHPEDRRSIVIQPTTDGQALIPHLAPIFGRINRQLLAGFSAQETQQLVAMLQRMLDNLHNEAADD